MAKKCSTISIIDFFFNSTQKKPSSLNEMALTVERLIPNDSA